METSGSRITVRGGKYAAPHPAANYSFRAQVTTHFRVAYDPALGTDGATISDAILASCETDYTTLQGYFGGITPASLPFQILITSGTFGASHSGCGDTTLSIGAKTVPGVDVPFMRQLVIAEEDEVFMDNFGGGWDCGASNGEGLSRALANDMVPGAEPSDFVSVPVWLDQTSPSGIYRQDFINNTDPTDSDYFSIGCSVLFVNWLHFVLNYSWFEIIAAGGAPLASTYTKLTGKPDAFGDFTTAINRLFPPGTPSRTAVDNPFIS